MKLLWATLLIPLISWSQCEPVNLITEKNSPFNQIPVVDQGNTGTCFAFVAAQMLNYKSVKLGQGKIAHPFWVTYKNGNSRKSDKISSGDTRLAIAAFKEGPNCSYETVEKNVREFSSKYGFPVNKILGLVERKGFFDENELLIRSCDIPGLYNYFQSNPLINVATSPRLLHDLISPSCELQKPPAWPTKTFGKKGLPSQVIHEASSALFKNRSPIAVSHCSYLWYNRKAPGITNFHQRNASGSCYREGGAHVALLVGQKTFGGQCNYLMRNSWGNGFSNPMSKDLTCLCKNKKTGQFDDNCSRKTHNNGQWSVEACWVPAPTVAKYTQSLMTVD